MIVKNIFSLLKWLCSSCVWIILSFMIFLPSAAVYAQDPDEEGVIFWGDEEEEEEEMEEMEEDEFEDEEEYLEDEHQRTQTTYLEGGTLEFEDITKLQSFLITIGSPLDFI